MPLNVGGGYFLNLELQAYSRLTGSLLSCCDLFDERLIGGGPYPAYAKTVDNFLLVRSQDHKITMAFGKLPKSSCNSFQQITQKMKNK